MSIYVDVNYQKDKLNNNTLKLGYSVNDVYGLSLNPSRGGVNKWGINAQKDKTSINNKLTIPGSIKTINISGKAGTTYLAFKILIRSRRIPLTINLNNFNFTASDSYAICAGSTSEIIINVYGSCVIATTAEC